MSTSATTDTATGGDGNAFKYVFIPADPSLPIQVREGDKSGGLSDDYLVKEAKRYFSAQHRQEREGSGATEDPSALDNASPAEKKALAEQIRSQYASQGCGGDAMANVDDDTLINMVRAAQSSAATSCEITALTVPTASNDHFAVSMYGASDARGRNLPENVRAAKLLEACGHGGGAAAGVHGDVFVGRCRDDEAGDVWTRVDFDAGEADPGSDWCKRARERGGGGGGGGKGSAPTLSGVMGNALGQQLSQQQQRQLTGDEVDGDGYRWSQTDEEVEIKFAVAPGTKAKYVKVTFARRTVKVVVAGQTLVSGETGGDVAVDDCTYTIQDEGSGGRELCVTLGKANSGQSWDYAVQRK